MIDDINKDEVIEQYLLGTLPSDLLNEFHNKLSTDQEFRNEVALQKDIIGNIKMQGRKDLRDRLDEFHNEFTSDLTQDTLELGSKRVKRLDVYRLKKYYWVAAASILLITVSVFLIISYNKTAYQDRLFQAYYKPFNGLQGNYRSLQSGSLSEKEQAFVYYNKGLYAESISLFKSVLGKGDDEIALFFLGNAYLGERNLTEAEKTFKIYLEKYKTFDVDSKWYLSLTYIKEKKEKSAKQLLKELADGRNDYSQNAKDILNKW